MRQVELKFQERLQVELKKVGFVVMPAFPFQPLETQVASTGAPFDMLHNVCVPIMSLQRKTFPKVNNFAVTKHEDIFVSLRQICTSIEKAKYEKKVFETVLQIIFSVYMKILDVLVVPGRWLKPELEAHATEVLERVMPGANFTET